MVNVRTKLLLLLLFKKYMMLNLNMEGFIIKIGFKLITNRIVLYYYIILLSDSKVSNKLEHSSHVSFFHLYLSRLIIIFQFKNHFKFVLFQLLYHIFTKSYRELLQTTKLLEFVYKISNRFKIVLYFLNKLIQFTIFKNTHKNVI